MYKVYALSCKSCDYKGKHDQRDIPCPECGKETYVMYSLNSNIENPQDKEGFPAIRTSDGFVKNGKTGTLISDSNDFNRKSYLKDAMERTKKDFAAIEAATHAKRGKRDE